MLAAAAGSAAASGARAAAGARPTTTTTTTLATGPRRLLRCRASAADADSATTAPATTTRRAALLLVPAAAAAAPLLFAAAPPRALADDESAVADALNNAAAAAEAEDAAAAASAAGLAPATPAPSAPARAAAASATAGPDVGAATFADVAEPILAYRFRLPTATAKGDTLSLTPSRRPERYSSAAPLSADARQRIVAEWLDLKRFVSVTVTVGPAVAASLRGKQPLEWRARDVAEAVLTDRSTGRLSSGQRTALMDVERAGSDDARPAPTGRAWTYEYLSQGSPTVAERGRETYRHAVAVSAARYGDKQGEAAVPFIWSVSFTCPERLWPDLEGPFRAAVASFALTEPTSQYVPPDRDPWRFF